MRDCANLLNGSILEDALSLRGAEDSFAFPCVMGSEVILGSY